MTGDVGASAVGRGWFTALLVSVPISFAVFAVPGVAILDRHRWWVVAGSVLLAALGVAIEAPQTREQLAGHRFEPEGGVSRAELAMAVWALPYSPAVAWVAAIGLGWLVQAGADLLDWSDSIGHWTSVGTIAFLSFGGSMVAVEDTSKALSSATAGLDSAFRSLAARTRPAVVVLLLAGIPILGVAAWQLDRTWALFLFFVYALYATVPAATAEEPALDREASGGARLEGAVAAFAERGLRAVPSPRTGLAEVDPLLVGVDFYVESASGATVFLVKLATDDGGAEVSWTEGSAVVHATRALGADGDVPLEAVLVLGPRQQPSEALRRLSDIEPLAIVKLGSGGEQPQVIGSDHPDQVGLIAASLAETTLEGSST